MVRAAENVIVQYPKQITRGLINKNASQVELFDKITLEEEKINGGHFITSANQYGQVY